MIQVTYGKPGHGMTHKPCQPVSEFRQTKQAINLLNYIDRFITYFERTKGHKPRSVLLRPEQLAALGVNPGTRRHGVALEVQS
ncbi:hypothetical protein [Marinobacter shengliensis]|uniref:hypothetical protein n=1 Tax=Marinobacter shengliensis TaxID=1389223 RepID=UPI000D1004BF|nr:hypothetical protein [Marinobacter shengliensis]PSF14172.1 hypothetical protein C7H10_05590 [Marinobacter shengliensis]